jgi:hypothetical protein
MGLSVEAEFEWEVSSQHIMPTREEEMMGGVYPFNSGGEMRRLARLFPGIKIGTPAWESLMNAREARCHMRPPIDAKRPNVLLALPDASPERKQALKRERCRWLDEHGDFHALFRELKPHQQEIVVEKYLTLPENLEAADRSEHTEKPPERLG